MESSDHQDACRDFFRRAYLLPQYLLPQYHRDCRRLGDRCMITKWRLGEQRVLAYPEIPLWWASGPAGEPHRMLRWALWEMI